MFRKFLIWIGYSQKPEPTDHVIRFNQWPNTFIKQVDKQDRIIPVVGTNRALRMTKSDAEKVCKHIDEKVGSGLFSPFKLDL